MTEYQKLSLTGSNSFHFRDGALDLELCYHPLSGRETVAFNGVIVSEERIVTTDFGYHFDFNGYAYMLNHDRPEDRSCNYYFQLSRNKEPLQRYEIFPPRKRKPALYLVAPCVVASFPAVAGEISEQLLGISVLDWSPAGKLAVIVAAAVSAIAIHLGLYGRLLIKNRMGPELKG